jgi:hypothetical protein
LVNFPKINDLNSEFYIPTSIQSSSIAQIIDNTNNVSWLDLYFVKENLKSKNGKFVLKVKDSGYTIESNTYYDVYDDKNWLILFGIKNDNYTSHYKYGDTDFTAYLHCINENHNDFYTESLGGDDTIYKNIHFQIGAFQHPSTYYSDVNIGAFRFYQKNYLDIMKDIENFLILIIMVLIIRKKIKTYIARDIYLKIKH